MNLTESNPYGSSQAATEAGILSDKVDNLSMNYDEAESLVTPERTRVNSRVTEFEKTPEQVKEELLEFAFNEIARKYGTGNKDGESPLFYHNLKHTKGVLEAAKRIATMALENGKIQESDLDLIEIAATFHDIEQDLGGGKNEEESARIVEDKMRSSRLFNDDDIEKVKKMILGTVVLFENGQIKQAGGDDYLCKIVDDADLYALGVPTEDHDQVVKGLMYEFAKNDNLTREQKLSFYQNQLKFLNDHFYLADETAGIFPHKEENILFTKKMIELYSKYPTAGRDS